jgi:hypothetical protein
MLSRWGRLERYARWKQRRFDLTALPFDVFIHVLSMLPHVDVCNVLYTLYNAPRENLKVVEARRVPRALHGVWFTGAAYDSMLRALSSFCDPGFYYARDCSFVAVHVNWSPYARGSPVNVAATYLWTPSLETSFSVNEACVRRVVADCVQRRMCAVTFSMYSYVTLTSGDFVRVPGVHLQLSHVVVPHGLLSESKSYAPLWW